MFIIFMSISQIYTASLALADYLQIDQNAILFCGVGIYFYSPAAYVKPKRHMCLCDVYVCFSFISFSKSVW